MSNLINKQKAIDTICRYCDYVDPETCSTRLDGDKFCPEIYVLQNMDTEQTDKTTIWIKPTGMMPPEHHGHYECSKCGGWAMRTWYHRRMVLTPYCPWCGASMTNGKAEESE